MTRSLTFAAIALSLAAGAAHAQRGPATATLYELPNFEGRSVTVTESTPDLGRWRFNDRAQSARFEGRWRVTDTNLETSSGLWCDPYGYCYSYSSNWYDAGELEAGLSYTIK